MTTTATEVFEGDPAFDALRRLADAFDEVRAISRAGFDRDRSLAFTAWLARFGAAVDAEYLAGLGELDLLERGALAGTRRGRYLAATSLEQAAGLGRARAYRDLRTAQALRDHLPQVAATYAAGATTRDHVELARRVPEQVKPSTWREHGRAADTTLAGLAAELDVESYRRAASHLLDTVDPARLDAQEPRLDDRSMSFARGQDGAGHLRGFVLPGDAAMIAALFDAHAQVRPTTQEADDDGLPYPVEDHRTTDQRQYDALMDVVRAGLATADSDSGRDGPGITPEIRVIASEGQLLDEAGSGGPEVDGWGRTSRRTAQQWLCVGILRRLRCSPDGGPLDVGRAQRYATATQRAALDVRDRGCVVPGCAKPAKACQAHHLVEWEHGGATALRNLALLCERHHREVHHGRWHLQITGGVVWVTAREDPLRRKVRNLRHAAYPLRC